MRETEGREGEGEGGRETEKEKEINKREKTTASLRPARAHS